MQFNGTVYVNHGYWYYRGKLPGEKKRTARPLCAPGAKVAMRSDRPREFAVQAAHRLWEGATRQLSVHPLGITVNDICAAWCAFVPTYYRLPDGQKTSESCSAIVGVRMFRDMYGERCMTELRHADMLCVRDALIRSGLCRATINKYLGLVKRMIGWALDEGYVTAAVKAELTQFKLIRPNRTAAPERNPVPPVPDNDIERTIAAMTTNTADMVRVQRLTGMRPNEICNLAWERIDTTRTPWVYTPEHHKNQWRGQERPILIGRKAREILLRHKDGKYPFSPMRSITEHFTDVMNTRAPEYPVHARRAPGAMWHSAEYTKSIHAACRRAKVKVWSANQLRHTFATEVRRKYGIMIAGSLLGHSNGMRVTNVYSRDAAADELVNVAGHVIEEIG